MHFHHTRKPMKPAIYLRQYLKTRTFQREAGNLEVKRQPPLLLPDYGALYRLPEEARLEAGKGLNGMMIAEACGIGETALAMGQTSRNTIRSPEGLHYPM